MNRIEQRVAEAEKLGFERIFLSKYNKKALGPEEVQDQPGVCGECFGCGERDF
ncbi:MAG: hypothetical protein MZV63_27260 [Marinilabiliales bacterium]|nr:hypothetical protein [Marinilabiliales bacterium]